MKVMEDVLDGLQLFGSFLHFCQKIFFMIILVPFKNVMSVIHYLILHCCILDATNKAIYMNYILQEESLFGSMYFTLGLNRVIGYKGT